MKVEKHIVDIADVILECPAVEEESLLTELMRLSNETKEVVTGWVEIARDYNNNRNSLMTIPKGTMTIAEVKKAREYNILSKNECLEILSDIARGKERRIEDEVMIPTETDRIKAIQELIKMQGNNI